MADDARNNHRFDGGLHPEFEMMAVMLSIAMLASLVVAMVPGTGRGNLKALTPQTAALLRRERLAAILTGQSRRVSLDGNARTIVGQAGTIAIPRDVRVDVIGVNELWSGRQAVVRVRAGRRFDRIRAEILGENVRYEVDVNWYNGRVAVDLP